MFVWMIGSSETVCDAFDTSEAKKLKLYIINRVNTIDKIHI